MVIATGVVKRYCCSLVGKDVVMKWDVSEISRDSPCPYRVIKSKFGETHAQTEGGAVMPRLPGFQVCLQPTHAYHASLGLHVNKSRLTTTEPPITLAYRIGTVTISLDFRDKTYEFLQEGRYVNAMRTLVWH